MMKMNLHGKLTSQVIKHQRKGSKISRNEFLFFFGIFFFIWKNCSNISFLKVSVNLRPTKSHLPYFTVHHRPLVRARLVFLLILHKCRLPSNALRLTLNSASFPLTPSTILSLPLLPRNPLPNRLHGIPQSLKKFEKAFICAIKEKWKNYASLFQRQKVFSNTSA